MPSAPRSQTQGQPYAPTLNTANTLPPATVPPATSPPGSNTPSAQPPPGPPTVLTQVTLSEEDDSLYELFLNTAKATEAVNPNPESLIFVPVALESKPFSAMIDSGASSTFVSRSVVTSLQLPVTPEDGRIHSAFADSRPRLKLVRGMTLTLGEKTVPINA